MNKTQDQLHPNPVLCEQEKIEHLATFDRAIQILDKYDHGRCHIYRTKDKVYFICKKPVR